MIQQTLKRIVDRGRTLPPTLYILLDNTCKQNKSRYFFAYCAWLIYVGTFKKIIVSFLPVGHTHEDIDQLFSRIAIHLRQSDALSRADLALCVQRAFSKSWLLNSHPVVLHLDRATNFSDYITPFIGKTRLRNHSKFSQFKIWSHPDTCVPVMAVKKWCGVRGETWGGLEACTHYHENFKPDVVPPRRLVNVKPAQRGHILDDSVTTVSL